MAIGSPFSLGTPVYVGGGGGSATLVTSSAVPAGSDIIVVASRGFAYTGTTFTDTDGNTYEVVASFEGTNGSFVVGRAHQIPAQLASGKSITVNFGGGSQFGTRMISALAVSGLGSYEGASTLLDSGFTNSFVTAGRSNVAANAFLLGIGQAQGGDKTWTSGSPWTELYEASSTGVNSFSVQHQTVSSAASRSTALTTSANAAGVAAMLVFAEGTAPALPMDASIRLSGSGSVASSIGGAPSGTEYVGTDLFDDSSYAEYSDGHTDYRLVYVFNDDTRDATVRAYITTQLESGRTISIGAPTQAAGVTVTAIANDTTAPATVTFSAPTTAGSGVDLGTIPAGSYRGLWLRRVINAGTAADATNAWQVELEVTPA